MKKLITLLLAASLLATSAFMLFSCNDSTEEPDDTAVTTEATDDTTASAEDTKENPLANLEKLPENISELVSEGELSLVSSKAILALVYTQGETSYNWNTFYNACIDGTIDLSAAEIKPYLDKCLNLFETQSMSEQEEQVKAVMAAVEQ